MACFINRESHTFAALCEEAGYPTDLGGYYLRQLVKGGYLIKQERGVYGVTPKGKSQLAISYGRLSSVMRPRLITLLVAKQGERFVVLRRRAQPFIGAAEWPARSVTQGETLNNAAADAVRVRFGVDAAPVHKGFFRRIDIYGGAVFDDKLFAVFTVSIPSGIQLEPEYIAGELLLLTASEVRSIDKPGRSILDIFDFVQATGSGYAEHVYQLLSEDLSL